MSTDVLTRQEPVSAHYLGERGRQYWNSDGGRDFGRRYQTRYFRPYCGHDKVVLDFGCADGFFLRQLPAKDRIGVEVNSAAIEKCREYSASTGIDVQIRGSLREVASHSVDLVISNHCLEHVPCPHSSLRQMHRILRPDGHLALVVPFEGCRRRPQRTWRPDDRDHHLYTWNPLHLGNLVTEAGFEVLETRVCTSAWSPRVFWVGKMFGLRMFGLSCYFWSLLTGRKEVFCHAIRRGTG